MTSSDQKINIEEIEINRRRQSNRDAAARARKKQRDDFQALKKKVLDLEAERTRLQYDNHQLSKQNKGIAHYLINHHCTCGLIRSIPNELLEKLQQENSQRVEANGRKPAAARSYHSQTSHAAETVFQDETNENVPSPEKKKKTDAAPERPLLLSAPGKQLPRSSVVASVEDNKSPKWHDHGGTHPLVRQSSTKEGASGTLPMAQTPSPNEAQTNLQLLADSALKLPQCAYKRSHSKTKTDDVRYFALAKKRPEPTDSDISESTSDKEQHPPKAAAKKTAPKKQHDNSPALHIDTPSSLPLFPIPVSQAATVSNGQIMTSNGPMQVLIQDVSIEWLNNQVLQPPPNVSSTPMVLGSTTGPQRTGPLVQTPQSADAHTPAPIVLATGTGDQQATYIIQNANQAVYDMALLQSGSRAQGGTSVSVTGTPGATTGAQDVNDHEALPLPSVIPSTVDAEELEMCGEDISRGIRISGDGQLYQVQ